MLMERTVLYLNLCLENKFAKGFASSLVVPKMTGHGVVRNREFLTAQRHLVPAPDPHADFMGLGQPEHWELHVPPEAGAAVFKCPVIEDVLGKLLHFSELQFPRP